MAFGCSGRHTSGVLTRTASTTATTASKPAAAPNVVWDAANREATNDGDSHPVQPVEWVTSTTHAEMRVTDPGSWTSQADVPVYVIRLRGNFHCMSCTGLASGAPASVITLVITKTGEPVSFGLSGTGDLSTLGPVGTFSL